MSRWKLAAASLLVCSCLLLAGCPREATIGEILDDPGRFDNKDVAIRGTVTNSFGVLGHGAYELEDGTGKMWVVVEKGNGVPSKGARVRSAGRIVHGFTFSGRNLGTALREKGHKIDR